MTPLYDVISTQPDYAEGRTRRNQLKLAMAVGNNRHCIINEILPRHFLQSAEAAGIPVEQFHRLLHDIEQSVPSALERTARAMPDDFPGSIIEPILEAAERRTATVRALFV